MEKGDTTRRICTPSIHSHGLEPARAKSMVVRRARRGGYERLCGWRMGKGPHELGVRMLRSHSAAETWLYLA